MSNCLVTSDLWSGVKNINWCKTLFEVFDNLPKDVVERIGEDFTVTVNGKVVTDDVEFNGGDVDVHIRLVNPLEGGRRRRRRSRRRSRRR